MNNDNYQLQGTNIQQIRNELLKRLKSHGEVDQLLIHVLNYPRTQLYAYAETPVHEREKQQISALLRKRLNGIPLAYLTGKCDFFSLEFMVSPQVLIPRPETEMLVNLVIESAPKNSQVLELGTGCGAVAIAIAHERKDLSVTATDIMPAALDIARKNAVVHHVSTQIKFVRSNWFSTLTHQQFNLIISNPPYVSIGDPELAEEVARYEPAVALFAEADGLAHLRTIIKQATRHLSENGLLAVEHGFQQAPNVVELLEAAGFSNIRCLKDLANLPRVNIGEWKVL